MKTVDLLERIEVSTDIMAGQPVIAGTRLTVHYILNLLGAGATQEEILREYEGLDDADIQACLPSATQNLRKATI